MKILLVFLGMMVVSVTFIAYEGDMNHYLRLQTNLKAAAEEAAAGASLYYEEEAFASGILTIKEEDARLYVEEIVSKTAETLSLDPEKGESLTYSLEIQDGIENPYITVSLNLKTQDLFRLSFLDVTEVTRKARYELAEF